MDVTDDGGSRVAELRKERDVTQSTVLADLRTAMGRYDIPDQAPAPDPAQLRIKVDQAITLRQRTDLAGLLRMLPGLLTRATTYAHAAASQLGWALLADVYSVVYALAARNRWMDLVEVAPTRQAWATDQQPNPLVTAQATLSGPEQAFATGALHLRGMVLAGLLSDRTEAQRHIDTAWTVAEKFPKDLQVHNQRFGPADTVAHVLATEGDLGRPREVIRLSTLTSLLKAWDAVPESEGPPDEPGSAAGADLFASAQQPPARPARPAGRADWVATKLTMPVGQCRCRPLPSRGWARLTR